MPTKTDSRRNGSLTAIKQNLKIHAFAGVSKCRAHQEMASITRFCGAKLLKFVSKTGWPEQRILRILQAHLFSKKGFDRPDQDISAR